MELEERFDAVMEELLTADKHDSNDIARVLDNLGSFIDAVDDTLTATHRMTLKQVAGHWLMAVEAAWFRCGLDEESTHKGLEATLDAVRDALHHVADHPTKTMHVHASVPSVVLRELSFMEAGFGWQTWGSSLVLARAIAAGDMDVRGRRVLELGCGTGLVGIVAALKGAADVLLTDFLPEILHNARFNAEANNVGAICRVAKLDWRAPAINETFDLIVAADCCYELQHAQLLPPVLRKFLSATDTVAHMVNAMRSGFDTEIAAWEAALATAGLRIASAATTLDATAVDDGPPTAFRRYAITCS
ncbi:hypothetical protein ACHHYP_04381 [Achlya hypogyna]|uniref:Uncharacterized protein n=1 Tax=Achlya hypogyna TaxID=1202772 RepID=A0A1V9Z187_ACHHY|nr:hypothetical protein ACHHYP_04381 [Achlya hypogyna]